MGRRKPESPQVGDEFNEIDNNETQVQSSRPVFDCFLCNIKIVEKGKGENKTKEPKVTKLTQVNKKPVKIEREQAEVLNQGRIWGGNNQAEIYFLPDNDELIVPASDEPEEE